MLLRNKYCLLLAALHVVLIFSAQGQELEISVSPTPVGSGARAAGMADAFVAIADDATAASWNPAGLVQLERPELSVVGAYYRMEERFNAFEHDEVNSRHTMDELDLNYFSLTYPLPFLIADRNAVVSFSYQRKYIFAREFSLNYTHSTKSTSGSTLTTFQQYDFEQEGGLGTLSPAFAVELTHRLSIGATVNFWRSSWFSENNWSQNTTFSTFALFGDTPILAHSSTEEKYEDFSGENLTLGLLWTPTDTWSFGARYDTAFSGNAQYHKNFFWTQMFPVRLGQPGGISVNEISVSEDRSIHFPDSLALGVAHRFNDRLTVSLDITWTNWNDYYVVTGEGERRSLVDGSNIDDPESRTDMDVTYTIRCGAEYLFLPTVPTNQLARLWSLRGGLFIDQEPATGREYGADAKAGSGNADTFYGFSLGAGCQLQNRVNLDAAYQLRYGDDVNGDFIRGIPGFSEDVTQHRFLLSSVIYF